MTVVLPPDHIEQQNKRIEEDRKLVADANKMGVDTSHLYSTWGILNRAELQKRIHLYKIANRPPLKKWQIILMVIGGIASLVTIILGAVKLISIAT